MATANHVQEVRVFNLMFLLALQKSIAEDQVRACAMYGVSAQEADLLRGLSLDAVHTLAGSMNECIATLRFSAATLISLSKVAAPMQTVLGALHGGSPREASRAIAA